MLCLHWACSIGCLVTISYPVKTQLDRVCCCRIPAKLLNEIELKMKRSRSLPATPKKVLLRKRVPNSPNTPLKQGRRKVEQKDSFCLCCGVCLIGAKSTFNAFTCEGLLEKLKELTETSINLDVCSTRVCKPCYREIYWCTPCTTYSCYVFHN